MATNAIIKLQADRAIVVEMFRRRAAAAEEAAEEEDIDVTEPEPEQSREATDGFRFLDLPPELRLNVYDLLIHKPIKPNHASTRRRPSDRKDDYLALALMNRQSSAEVTRHFYLHHDVYISLVVGPGGTMVEYPGLYRRGTYRDQEAFASLAPHLESCTTARMTEYVHREDVRDFIGWPAFVKKAWKLHLWVLFCPSCHPTGEDKKSLQELVDGRKDLRMIFGYLLGDSEESRVESVVQAGQVRRMELRTAIPTNWNETVKEFETEVLHNEERFPKMKKASMLRKAKELDEEFEEWASQKLVTRF